MQPRYVGPVHGQARPGQVVDGWRRKSLAALLLAQELEHGGKIFIGVTASAHHTVDLMGQGAERDGSLCVGGRVLCEAQILK